ncbi:RNA 2',3'-cyclic phosphodiesterase [Tistrella bauzanensis]
MPDAQAVRRSSPPRSRQEALSGLRGGLTGARWTAPANLHLTLRFIGEVDGPSVADALDALGTIDVVPLTLSLKGLGLFGPARRPGILWIDVDGGPELIELQRRVDAAIDGAGLPRDRRRFTPHITLARLRRAADDRLDRYLTTHAAAAVPPFTVDAMHLFESRLGHEGPVYSSLGAFGGLAHVGGSLDDLDDFAELDAPDDSEYPMLATSGGRVQPGFDGRGHATTSWGGPPSPWRDADIWPHGVSRRRRRR